MELAGVSLAAKHASGVSTAAKKILRTAFRFILDLLEKINNCLGTFAVWFTQPNCQGTLTLAAELFSSGTFDKWELLSQDNLVAPAGTASAYVITFCPCCKPAPLNCCSSSAGLSNAGLASERISFFQYKLCEPEI